MDPLWLLPIAVVLFFLWAGWKVRRRRPDPLGDPGHRRDSHSFYDGGSAA